KPFQHEIRGSVFRVSSPIENSDDIGMIQGLKSLTLSRESFARVPIRREVLPEELYRNVLIQLQIASTSNLGHPSPARFDRQVYGIPAVQKSYLRVGQGHLVDIGRFGRGLALVVRFAVARCKCEVPRTDGS